jgi:hypothetical protein
MTILDGKKARFFQAHPTADGRWWTVVELSGGKVVFETSFLGSQEDADAIAVAWTKRDMDHYEAESRKAVRDWTAPRPTLEEVAASLGIKLGGDDS